MKLNRSNNCLVTSSKGFNKAYYGPRIGLNQDGELSTLRKL